MKASAVSYCVNPGSMRHSTGGEGMEGRSEAEIWLRSVMGIL
jgi:hypothetical protein